METLTASSTLGIDLRFWVAVVTLSGFEPLTCPLGGGCSIQLSHRAVDVVLGGLRRQGKLECLRPETFPPTDGA